MDCWVVSEDGVDNPVTERVDAKLRYVDDVLPHQVALPALVQSLEPVVETSDLAQGEASLITESVLLVSYH